MPRTSSPMFISFQNLANELDKFFTEEWNKLVFKNEFLHTKEKDKILLANIRLDLEECSHAFFMLYNSLLKLRKDQQLILIEKTSYSLQKRMQKTQRLVAESTVLIKSIYNLFFSIREMLSSSPKLKELLTPSTLIELDRVCEFRSKLIVHKQDQKLFTGSARKYNTEDLNITLQIGQYTPRGKEVYGQCKKLYESSQKFFHIEDQNYDNYYEIADMLYKNLSLVPKHLKSDVKGFIAAYGVCSDPPLKLGELLRNLVFEYFRFVKELQD